MTDDELRKLVSEREAISKSIGEPQATEEKIQMGLDSMMKAAFIANAVPALLDRLAAMRERIRAAYHSDIFYGDINGKPAKQYLGEALADDQARDA